MAGKTQNTFQKLTKSYKLSISDKSNFTEVYTAGVSRLKAYLLVFLVFVLSAAVVVSLLFFTPLKQVVPGYPKNDIRKLMIYNAMMVDSMELELEKRDNYLEQIRQVIKGDVVDEALVEDVGYEQVVMEPMNSDTIFDALIGPDKYKFGSFSIDEDFNQIARLNFFTPVQGVVINKFNASPGHFGTDIVGEEDSHIASVLDGTVVFAEWSVSTGYVVQIQHEHNLISVYKHNSDILVKSGDHVKAGNVIAIMGNEGELSTGPHLHFELWQNGIPLDSEQYISF